jgi:transposase
VLTDRNGWPLHADISSASPHEVKLIEPLVATAPALVDNAVRLVYDKAADSEPLRQRLKSWGLRLIHPFIKRRNQPERKLPPRDLKHYRHRWKIERTFGWLKHFRRLTSRWEYHAHLHLGFWQLGCLITILKAF